MNNEMKKNIRSEMREMKERLDTLTASLEEHKIEGLPYVFLVESVTCYFRVVSCLCVKRSLVVKPFI